MPRKPRRDNIHSASAFSTASSSPPHLPLGCGRDIKPDVSHFSSISFDPTHDGAPTARIERPTEVFVGAINHLCTRYRQVLRLRDVMMCY
mmetsp:Transcript_16479/g.45663  ORF Transcript_16479/g.45663 Transcript_16479/m.45663 type:complete len:90 (+) Transcript_16479:321-590(+)